jgi:hypothetical protein
MPARYAPNALFRITPEVFDEIDDWIRAANQAGRNAQFGINALVALMARTNQAFAQEMSAGFLDQRMTNPSAAWKIPVRRITSRYYKGWFVGRLAPGIWILSNTSREAYFIEFGIHPTGSYRKTEKGTGYTVRVRRPIRKLSLMKTLRFIDQSRARERVWEVIFSPFRPERGRIAGNPGMGIAFDQVQSVRGMRNI